MKNLRNTQVLAAAFGLLTIGVIAAFCAQVVRDAQQWVDHTRQVQLSIVRLSSLLTEAETLQRGYLLTTDTELLARYRQVAPELLPAVDNLLTQTADNLVQQSRGSSLRDEVKKRVSLLEQVVTLAVAERLLEAQALIKQGRGQRASETILRLLQEMAAEEAMLLTERLEKAQRAYRTLIVMILSATAAGVSLLLLIRQTTLRDALRLAQSEQRYRSFFELGSVGFVQLDQSGCFIDMNERLVEITGFSRQELLQRRLTDLVNGDDDGSQRKQLGALFAGTVERYKSVQRFRSKDQRMLWVQLEAARVPASPNRPAFIAGVVQDITEKKQAEDSLRDLSLNLERRVNERTEELREANTALESFSYMVSHDMRAPLRSIQGFAHALNEDFPAIGQDPQVAHYLARITASSQRMEHLIEDLLAYSRLSRSELTLQPTALDQVVSEARRQLESVIAASKAQFDVQPALPEVMGNHTVLVQVLQNLIANAIKFVLPGTQPKIVIRATQTATTATLRIQDNGIGIESRHYERVFEPFERLHGVEAYEGTGMGLAIVRRAIERFNGRCGVQSAPGAGSCFWLELTLARPATQQPKSEL